MAMRRDFYIGAFSLFSGLVLYFWLIPQWVETPGFAQTSPLMFPNISAIALVIIGACLVFNNFQGIRDRKSSGIKEALLEAVIWLVIVSLTLLGILHIGFVAANAFVCFVCMLSAGQRKHLVWVAIFCVAFPIILNLVAAHVFDVALP